MFGPIVVGERPGKGTSPTAHGNPTSLLTDIHFWHPGEPAFRGPVFAPPTAEDRARMQQNRAREASQPPDHPPRSPVFRPPPITRSQNILQTREDPVDALPAPEVPVRVNGRAAVRDTAPRRRKEHTRPTLEQLQEILADLHQETTDYPEIEQEIGRMKRVVGMLQQKEVWMEDTLKQVQAMRLTLQQHYVSQVKVKPWLLQGGRPAAGRGGLRQRSGDVDENPFLDSRAENEEQLPRYDFVLRGEACAVLTGVRCQTVRGTRGEAQS